MRFTEQPDFGDAGVWRGDMTELLERLSMLVTFHEVRVICGHN